MSGDVVLDTHALVWLLSAPQRLSERARARIETADTVAISAASAWEMALLADAGRIELDRPVDTWMHHAVRQASLRQIAIDVDIALTAVALGERGFHRDPADRFIYATAARGHATLVSKDQAILAFAEGDPAVAVCW